MTDEGQSKMNEGPEPARKTSRVVTARIIVKEDGSVEYEGDPAAIADAIEHEVRGKGNRERKKKAWGMIGKESMTRLAKLFPSTRTAPGVEPWNIDKFLPWATSGVLSHGEVLAAKFLLSVWNPGSDWEEIAREEGCITDAEQHFARFDLFEAMGVWDLEHIAAMQAWIDLPFFP